MKENKEILKNLLLSTHSFIDNTYLDNYIGLVFDNLSTPSIKAVTQTHHILPRSYYKLFHLTVDNSEDNLVNLVYKDHIMAHYYLCLCTNGKLQYKLSNAFFHLVNRKWKYSDFDPKTDLTEYEELYRQFILNISQDRERSEKLSNSLNNMDAQSKLLKSKRQSESRTQQWAKLTPEQRQSRIDKLHGPRRPYACSSKRVFSEASIAKQLASRGLKPYSYYKSLLPKSLLYSEYVINNKTKKQLCEDYNIKITMLERLIVEYSISKYNYTSINELENLLPKEVAYDLYINQNKKIKEIATMCNSSESTIGKLFRKYKIRKFNFTDR